jgi:hypothetical protein
MTTKTQGPVLTTAKSRPENSTPPAPKAQPTEPAEVFGRHKNTGQKDHKGAR